MEVNLIWPVMYDGCIWAHAGDGGETEANEIFLLTTNEVGHKHNTQSRHVSKKMCQKQGNDVATDEQEKSSENQSNYFKNKSQMCQKCFSETVD